MSVSLQESNTKWSLQFNMNYLKQTFGSVGQQPVSGECLMMPFYCFRRSRSSKLSFCSPQGTRAAAVRIHSALCLCTREEVGQASSHRTVFTGGWALGGHHNIVVLPFCAEERGACEYCHSGRHRSRLDADQIAFLAWFSSMCMHVSECVCVRIAQTKHCSTWV